MRLIIYLYIKMEDDFQSDGDEEDIKQENQEYEFYEKREEGDLEDNIKNSESKFNNYNRIKGNLDEKKINYNNLINNNLNYDNNINLISNKKYEFKQNQRVNDKKNLNSINMIYENQFQNMNNIPPQVGGINEFQNYF